MPYKLGDGGNGPELYDDSTGQYVKEENTKKYKSKSGVDDQDIISELSKDDGGFFGKEFKEVYDGLDDEGKKEFIDFLQNELSGQTTERKITEEFAPIDKYKYNEMRAECENVYRGEREALNWLYGEYCGGGHRQFEFNKYLRLGLEAYKTQKDIDTVI